MIKTKRRDPFKQNKFVMEVNYFGVLNCVKAVENIIKTKKGHISIVSKFKGIRFTIFKWLLTFKAALNNFNKKYLF